MRKLLFIGVVAAVLLVAAAPALGQWTEVHPGVDYRQWTTNAPQRISAVRVDLCYPGVSLRATKSDERTRTTSSFGNLVGAEVAVNGDFFSWQNNYDTSGLAIGDGEVWPGSSDTTSHGFIAFGDKSVMLSNPPDHVTDTSWMHDAVGGNIMVLLNGQVTGDSGSFCTTRHPRTVAGLSQDERTLFLAAVDGRASSSVGMRCDELGQMMKNIGAHNALNFDGGGSTTMWMRGHGVVNQPSDGSQRTVANHLAVHADGTGRPEACSDLKADFQVRYRGLDDFYADGSSNSVPDVLVGDSFEAEILFQNSSATIFRGVQLDYWFETPFLAARDYTIYSDHPHYDRATWSVNSADSDDGNPPKDAMGQTGPLEMHAFSAQETKRVLIELEATEYSIGRADHPDVRAWMRHIDDLYGEQTGWDQQPTNANHIGRLLQDFAQLDVLSPYEWQFNGGEDQLEGWRECDGHSTPSIDASAGTMGLGDGCARGPGWTAVDANRWDQMVLRTHENTGAGWLEVEWIRDGEAFDDAQRAFSFEVDAQQPGTFVVPVSERSGWSDEVVGLRVKSWSPSGDTPAAGVSVDAIFFQDSNNQTTSSATEPYVDTPPVAYSSVGPTTGEDTGVEPDATNDAGTPSEDTDAPSEDTGQPPTDDAGAQADTAGPSDSGNMTNSSGSTASGSCGCTSPGAPPPALPWLIAATVLAALVARLAHRRPAPTKR